MWRQTLGSATIVVLFSQLACSGNDKPVAVTSGGGSLAVGGASAMSTNATGGAGAAQAGGVGTGGTQVVQGGASAAGGATAASSGGSGGCGGTATLGTVTPAALYTELQAPNRAFLLINVHTPLAGNIPGTDADIVYTDVPGIEAFIGTDKSKPVVIYCMTDHMATIAGPTLVSDGYCNVSYLVGGLSAWQAAGYPVDPT